MRDKNVLYYLGFSHFLGIGPVRFQNLILHLGGVKEAYEALKEKLEELIGVTLAQEFVEFRERFDLVEKWEELKKKDIKVVTQEDSCYPPQLKHISDAPICLYVKGDINVFYDSAVTNFVTTRNSPRRDVGVPSKVKNLLPPPQFAIVGTRTPTSYGQQVARKFARELAEAGFVIVSGMAMGIDAVAHWGALEAGGKTIAVLGCGIDIIYPAVNRNLYEKIVNGGGVVISEFPPGHRVLKGFFVARNRIISGLSTGVLVVEGAKDSGTLITARYAAEQGKDVFAPPGPLTSQMSEAPNMLLKQGAKLVTSVDDIFEELGLRIVPKKKEEMREKLNDEEKILFDLLQNESMTVDEIALLVNRSIEEVLYVISLVEIKGIVEKNSEGKYQIKL